MIFNDKVQIEMFPAGAGDCFLINFLEEDYIILIDGGFACTYKEYLRIRLLELAKQNKRIGLLVISHIDSDHIGGIISFLKENGKADDPHIIGIDEVWYNAFYHVKKLCNNGKKMSYTQKEVLKEISINSVIDTMNEKKEISVLQGNTVAGLLLEGGYNWNTMWSEESICIENGKNINLTKNICLTLLNPSMEQLEQLADFWIKELKRRVKGFIICENRILFDEAFEGYMCRETEIENTERKEISVESKDKINKDWEKYAIDWKSDIDRSKTNQSSIAFLLEYKGLNMLFPGDCPIQLFEDKLPKRIHIVKLPHHGSEKNITADFIKKTKVEYYLLSTEGNLHGHPSVNVVANILKKTPQKAVLLKNYDITGFDTAGWLMEEKSNE